MAKEQNTAKLMNYSLEDKRKQIATRLHNKFFELAKSNFETDLNYRQWDYVFRRYWSDGQVAAFKIKFLEDNPDDVLRHADAGFAQVGGMSEYDIYFNPSKINLVNTKGFPWIPKGMQTVDKDVVIGYITGDRKGLYSHISQLVDEMVDVAMCQHVNMLMQKCPYLISVDSDEVTKANDVMKRILFSDVPVIFAEGINPMAFKSNASGADYIIDKLQNYYNDLQSEVLTFLGIDNSGTNKVEQVQLSEVQSHAESVNLGDDQFDTELKGFCERCKKVLGINFYIRAKKNNDVGNKGEEHILGEKTGPKDELLGGNDNE